MDYDDFLLRGGEADVSEMDCPCSPSYHVVNNLEPVCRACRLHGILGGGKINNLAASFQIEPSIPLNNSACEFLRVFANRQSYVDMKSVLEMAPNNEAI